MNSSGTHVISSAVNTNMHMKLYMSMSKRYCLERGFTCMWYLQFSQLTISVCEQFHSIRACARAQLCMRHLPIERPA